MKPKTLFLARVGLFVILPAMFFAIACGTDDPERQAAKDREKILEYILQNNLNAIELPSGVFYVIEREGRGPFPTDSSNVTLTYTGRLLDGTQFDFGAQVQFNLRNTILGFRYGIPMFNRGAQGQIFIPSGLGYGPTGGTRVPPNSVLIFRVEIFDWR